MKEKELKYTKYGIISSIVLSLIAIAISMLSYNENVKSNLINEEEIRPRITLVDFNATYNKKHINFKYTLKNIGKSTAVIDDFEIAILKLNGVYLKKYHNLKNRIIEPLGNTKGSLTINRFLKNTNANFELDQIKIKPENVNFTFKYNVRGKPTLYFSETFYGIKFKWIEEKETDKKK